MFALGESGAQDLPPCHKMKWNLGKRAEPKRLRTARLWRDLAPRKNRWSLPYSPTGAPGDNAELGPDVDLFVLHLLAMSAEKERALISTRTRQALSAALRLAG